jgi:hypothetical protein
MTANVAAVFLFNHRFERNVEKLEAIYADRFPRRTYLMPFAREDHPNVARVFETSWTFSGHIAQGASRFIEPGVDHYVFISDDLILNPRLDAGNIVDALGLGARTAYIKSLAGLDALRYRWHRSLQATIALRRLGSGFDYLRELPSADEARLRFERMGIDFPRPVPRNMRELAFLASRLPRSLGVLGMPWALRLLGVGSDYPLLSGYSDFLVVPGEAIERFVTYCGVLAALDIFAEVAVPTALALAAEEVRTELEPGELFTDPDAARYPDFPFRGVEFWRPEETAAFADRFGRDQARLLAEFPADWLYAHPVKLSQWR